MKQTPPPQSLEEAKAFVRAHIRSIAPQSLVDEHALRICGEPPERVAQILHDLRHELADGMASCNPQPPRANIFAMPLAFVELVRERAQELENGRGRA